MRWLGIAWNIAAVFFLLSVACAPAFLLVRWTRARGKRLFVDEPTARIRALGPDTRIDHRWDA